MVGATEQNLLKLFEWVINGGECKLPKIDNVKKSEKIIY